MVRRLSVSNLFCLQNRFSYKAVPHLLTSFHQEKQHLTLICIKWVPRDPNTMFGDYIYSKKPESSDSMYSSILILEKIRCHHFTKTGPNSQEIVNFYQFSLGPRELTIGTKFTISFHIKVVTKNIMFGSLVTQRKAALQYDVKFSEPNCYT